MLPSLRGTHRHPPKTKRLGRSRALTIALGIACRNGIVIGADSEISGPGDLKSHEGKVYHSDHPNGWRVLFAYAGDVSLYKEARSTILRKFAECDPTPDALKSVCDEIFTKMGRHVGCGVDLDMLFAVSCPKFEPRLLVFNGTGLSWSQGIKICGSGDAPLAQYLSEALWDGSLSTAQAVRAAIYMISRSKQYIGGIGGKMVVSVLQDGERAADVLPEEIEQIEREILARERQGLRDIVGLL